MTVDTSIPVSTRARDRVASLKRDGETWDEFLDRAADRLSTDDGVDTNVDTSADSGGCST